MKFLEASYISIICMENCWFKIVIYKWAKNPDSNCFLIRYIRTENMIISGPMEQSTSSWEFCSKGIQFNQPDLYVCIIISDNLNIHHKWRYSSSFLPTRQYLSSRNVLEVKN